MLFNFDFGKPGLKRPPIAIGVGVLRQKEQTPLTGEGSTKSDQKSARVGTVSGVAVVHTPGPFSLKGPTDFCSCLCGLASRKAV